MFRNDCRDAKRYSGFMDSKGGPKLESHTGPHRGLSGPTWGVLLLYISCLLLVFFFCYIVKGFALMDFPHGSSDGSSLPANPRPLFLSISPSSYFLSQGEGVAQQQSAPLACGLSPGAGQVQGWGRGVEGGRGEGRGGRGEGGSCSKAVAIQYS